MAARELSGVRAALPPVADHASAEETSRAAVTSDGFGCQGSRPAGQPAPTPLTASLFEGGLATRRAVLGAAVAVPVAAGVGGPAIPSSHPSPDSAKGDPWSLALAAYQEADAARARFEVATSAASAGPGGRPFDEQEALDEEYGVFVDAADEAMLALLEVPAPDLEALVVKIGLISAHSVWENDGGEDCLTWLEADARRLAGAAG